MLMFGAIWPFFGAVVPFEVKTQLPLDVNMKHLQGKGFLEPFDFCLLSISHLLGRKGGSFALLRFSCLV